MSAEQIEAVENKIASQGAPVAVEAPVTPPVAEVPTDEQHGEQVDPASTEGADGKQGNKKPASVRINELTKARREAERKVEAAEAEREYWRLQAIKLQTPAAPAGDAAKTLADFNFDQSAYDRYVIRQEIVQEMAQQEKASKAKVEQAKAAEREKSFHDRIAKFEAAHPDVDFVADVIQAPIAISEPMADFIKESDVGPEMGLYFKENPEEAKSIYGMTERQAERALAKLEVKLSSNADPAIPAQPVQITSAPPAPPRLNASSAGRSISDGVQAEIAAVRAQRNR